MKARNLITLIVIASLVLSFAGPGKAYAGDPPKQAAFLESHPYTPGELVVGFKANSTGGAMSAQATMNMAADVASAVGATVAKSGDGIALLKFDPKMDAQSMMSSALSQQGVAYTEPNYIYAIPEIDNVMVNTPTADPTGVVEKMPDGTFKEFSAEQLNAQRTKENGNLIQTYPNDGYWWNWGWSWIRTDLVWNNAAPSPTVCVLDTGVDATHPDLTGKVVNGTDFINEDAVSNDDHGHGTHVAGVITAKTNNALGMAGISNGAVLAVKVLSAQGWGENFDISQGIRHCANNATVKVLNLSLGGPMPSTTMYNAINYAVNTKGKLMVAAAGNSGWTTPLYPAGYSDPDLYPEFDGKILSVASVDSSYYVDTDSDGSGDTWRYGCRSWFSNYNDSAGENSNWVDVAAPGASIYSTTPYSTPFHMNYYNGVPSQYAYLSGTSMATPHVAAAAARLWSLYPSAIVGNPLYRNNADISSMLVSSGGWLNQTIPSSVGGTDITCWENANKPNGLWLASAMNRLGLVEWVYDAHTGLPIQSATVSFYQGAVPKATVVTDKWGYARAINMAPGTYTTKVFRAGYTAAMQPLETWTAPGPGYSWFSGVDAGLPPISGHFDAVANWLGWGSYANIDMYTFTPAAAGVTDPVLSWLNMGSFFSKVIDGEVSPYARLMRDGDGGDWEPIETTRIKSRPVNPAFAYYPGDYYIAIYDNGNALLGDYWGTTDRLTLRIWKGGLIRAAIPFTASACSAGTDWWVAAKINNGTITPLTSLNYDPDGDLTPDSNCGVGDETSATLPYTIPYDIPPFGP